MTDMPSFVGTWQLLSFVTPDVTGGSRPYWDDRASGLIVYTPDGRVSAQVYDARRPRLETPWAQVSPAAAQAAFVGMASYYGRYRVDASRSTVTHLIEGAMSPDWIGTELVRGYRFLTPDRIELRVLTSADGQSAEDAVLVWERVKA